MEQNFRMEIIGKNVMPFKVCSCPKRDMQREDSTIRPRKRESTVVPYGKRPSKMVCLPAEVKTEPETPSPVKNFEHLISDTPHTISLTMPNKDAMHHVLRCAFNEIAGIMARDKTQAVYYKPYADKIQDLINAI